MADVARCQEAIANYVLDAGEAVSCRSLASQIGGSAVRAQALKAFCHANASATGGVGAVRVSIAKSAKSADPRARVIRVSTVASVAADSDTDASIYGVFPSASSDNADESVHESMTLALWAQERRVRNELFAGRTRHAPLSRELQAFYESDVQCKEATSRADMMASSRGEEAVSMFDSIKATSTGRAQPAAAKASSSSSFFKSSSATTPTTSAASSSSKNGSSSSSSSSFFKSSGNSATTSAKAKPVASAATEKATATETKRIDAKAMNNVLSVDSDSDDDEDDGGAPKFVKTAPATKARATKRVMISDDEDEDFEMVDAPPASRPSAKRKLSDSPEPAVKPAKKPSSPAKSESPKRKRMEETVVDEEPQPEEEEALPTGPIKRRQLVNKTRITDDGYMVTEKTYEEVEVSVEELAKERAEAKKKQAAAKAAADAQKARAAAAAAASSKSGKAGGPAKQKKLDFFFTRK